MCRVRYLRRFTYTYIHACKTSLSCAFLSCCVGSYKNFPNFYEYYKNRKGCFCLIGRVRDL